MAINHNSIMPKIVHFSSTLRGVLTLLFFSCSLVLFSQLNIQVEGEDIGCFGLSSGTATATPLNGTPPYSYVWDNGGTTQTITNLSAGSYSVVVTDDNGATGTGSITLTEPTRVTATISDPLECEEPFMIAAEPEGGVVPYTYNWSTGADTRAVMVPSGDYCVTVVDANLCGYVACTTVTENPPVVTLVDVDVQCNGDDDGAITANPSGGLAPYTYAWSNGMTGQTISGLAPGVYGVTMTDARGCTATASTTITEPLALAGAIAGDASVCPGVADAFLFIAPTGGTAPYTYAWSVANATGQGVGPLPAGEYSVTVTDANGCTIVRSFVILTADEVEIEIEGDEILCGADATGALTASPVSGPTSQYVYEWSDGTNGPTLTNVTAGTYTVTATDVNGCTGTATATVTTVNLDLQLSSTGTSCFDGNDGTATAMATGGEQPYIYEWSNGDNTATITDLAPGVYEVTVTEAGDANCKVTGSVLVEEPDDITISAFLTNVDCAGAATGAIELTVVGGTAPYTYLWNTGATTQNLENIPAGMYTATVTDDNGCTESITINISEPTELAINEQINDVACNGDNTGSITVTVTGGTQPYAYAWSNGAATRTITNLPAGDYTVTVTDANGCDLVASYTVAEPSAISVTGQVVDIECAGDADGAINLTVSGGSGGYSYMWSNNATTEDLVSIPAGDYTVTVTDANECSETAMFTVNEPEEVVLTVTPTNVSCDGGTDGAIATNVTGGVSPYVIRLDNVVVAGDIINLSAGTYTISATDANGCVDATTVVIQEPTPFDVAAAVTPVACQGDASGAIDLTVLGATPGYTYAWSNNATTQDINGLVAGSYSVTITDANGCTFTDTYEITTNSAINIVGAATSATCNGAATGAINISVEGGSGNYAFQWSNNATTEDLSGLVAGDYTVTVTDANECDAVATFTVTEPDAIELTITAPSITCGGTETGTITAFPAGGTGPYTFAWSNGDSGMVLSNVGAGAYSVTVTDANGCMDVTNGIVLAELPELTCDIIVNQEPTEGNNGSISVEVDGGTFPYTYVWDDNSTDPNRDDLPAGTYSVTVTDANNCTTECMVTLQAFSGIGNFVWEDFNANGQQDPGEPGLDDYPVYLKNAAGAIIDSVRTDSEGNYAFTGLTPGTYSILFIVPPGGVRTTANFGDDTTDSDGDPAMSGMTGQYELDPGEFDMTVDAGFFAMPNGGISDPCNCLNNNTNDLDGQFSEQIAITAQPGQDWRIINPQNMFLLSSPAPPAAPIPVPVGTQLVEMPHPDSANLSIYILDFLIVDSFQYSVVVSNGPFDLMISNTCFYPEVRFEELPPEAICRFEAAILLEGFGQLNGEEIPGVTVFTINGVEVAEIDPMSLPLGEYTVTAEFVPDPAFDAAGLEICRPVARRQFILIDDCLAKLGDFVWSDTNQNGIQDDGEPGIPDVKVTVTNEDNTFMEMTTTDENGMYMFTLPPGTYKVTFEQPDGFDATIRNSGSNDELDSDMSPSTLMTQFVTLAVDEMNFSLDAGFIPDCIENFEDGGTIAADQTLCGPGNIPDPIIETSPATGGIGDVEYLWMMTTDNSIEDILFWTPIPNSNTPNYAPPALFETTYYARCVRRNNCAFIESNAVTILVDNADITTIEGPTSVCVGEEVTYTAVNAGDAFLNWSFTGNFTPVDNTDNSITIRWNTFGSRSVTLVVDNDGCISTNTVNVSVTNSPSQCGGSLTASGSVNNLQARDVTIEWDMSADGTDYTFALERSVDGANFAAIATVTAPQFISSNDLAVYRQDDISPLAGRTFYRVRMIDETYGDVLSNVVEMQLGEASTMLGRIFPNPANGGMIHVEMTDETVADEPASVQLYDVRGNAVGPRRFLRVGTGVINLDAQQQTAGVYFLRISVGERTETHRVIVE